MQNGSTNIELEKRIDAYVKGNLTEQQAQNLWVELLKQPEYIDQLETEIDIARYYQQQSEREQKSNNRSFKKWVAAAAAIILIAIGLNLFTSEALNNYTIEKISLRKNLATANIMRSKEPNFKTVDSLLNMGFDSAVSGDIEQALIIYRKIISNHPQSLYAVKAHLNIGILTYNKGNFNQALQHFEKVVTSDYQNDFILEQAYWYLANTYINVEELEKAHQALQNVDKLNGIHQQIARDLLDKVDKQLNNN